MGEGDATPAVADLRTYRERGGQSEGEVKVMIIAHVPTCVLVNT